MAAHRRLVVSACLCVLATGRGQNTKFSTGVVVDRDSRDLSEMYQMLADRYNRPELRAIITPIIERIYINQSLDYEKSMCSLMKHGVFSIFGELSETVEPLVDDYTSSFQMPFVTISEAYGKKWHQSKIRVLPDIAPALKSLLTEMLNWDKAYYFYNTRTALYRFARMAEQLQSSVPAAHLDLRLVKILPGESAMARLEQLLTDQQLKLLPNPEVKVLLDLGPTMNVEILNEMYQNREKKLNYHFLIADLATVQEVDWYKFFNGGMNVTCLQTISMDNETWQDNVAYNITTQQGFTIHNVSLRRALTVDAFQVMIKGFSRMTSPQLQVSERYDTEFSANISKGTPSCERLPPIPWGYGGQIAAQFKQVKMQGLTGQIEFDEYGFRKNYKFDIITVLKKAPPCKIGFWHNGEITEETPKKILNNLDGQAYNRTRIITTLLKKPYAFLKEGGDPYAKDMTDQLDGYSIELAREVMEHLNISYRIKVVSDNKSGSERPNMTWDGMVGEIMRGEADLAIADLTVTSSREAVIYFSKPFLRLGISIMIKKPDIEKQSGYSFIKPLADEVWICVGFAYIGVSVVLFLVGRFSPYEWHINTSGSEAQMTNAFSVWNSLWFVFSTLMQQGCEVAPRAVSSRIVASVWYLFTLIIISSYTANLAAFLTAARMNSPINSVEDLAKQTAIKYGTQKKGATNEFFKTSTYPVYQKMWNFMEKNVDVFTENGDEGVERVRQSNGRYAYLLESTTNEYLSNRQPCNTMKVGANLNSAGYGIGMPLDSDLKSKLNIAILKLREMGKLAELQKKWWEGSGSDDFCQPDAVEEATSRLQVSNIAGIFHILGLCIGCGIVMVVFELVYRAKIDAVKSDGQTSFLESLKSHLMLSMKGGSEDNDPTMKVSSVAAENGSQRRNGSQSHVESLSKDKPGQYLTVDSYPEVFTSSGNLGTNRRRSQLHGISDTSREGDPPLIHDKTGTREKFY